MQKIQSWQMQEISSPMLLTDIAVPELTDGEALVRVSGCGVCHTDLGFFYDGVRTSKALPLVLGHEISGVVVDAAGADHWAGKAVIIPAVLPCGQCELCRRGRGTICRNQKMPGNHIDGGFASHIVVPTKYLCPVDVADENDAFGTSGVTLQELSVIADAVTTPYQAILNSGLTAGDLALFIGVGGIGGFGVQIAKAMGANVVAIDIDDQRLKNIEGYGADVTFNATGMDPKGLRKEVRDFVAANSISSFEWKIFETSGTPAGQELAFSLLTFGATLSIVGFTMKSIQIRMSNLMAFDARALGNWGCHPQYYPPVLELVRTGQIKLGPFVQTFPMSEINTVFERAHRHEIDKRPILVPDFD